jgi:signal transduction histidine kinase
MTTPEVTIASLQETIRELEAATKVLVRRDLELKRAYRELEEIDRRKSEFVSIAAHQLRTPLSAIRWALQMLLDGEVGTLRDDQILTLKQAQQSIIKMIALVNDLLSADHLEYDKVLFEQQRTKLNLLVREIVGELSLMADERSITISAIYAHEDPVALLDANQCKEALLNIVNNAIKYSRTGTTVTIAVRHKDGLGHIEITDTGIGIPKNFQPRMFKKFSRADNAQRIDADGSGLGLFISKKIITAQGGTITCTSEEGAGTQFTVSLPLVT